MIILPALPNVQANEQINQTIKVPSTGHLFIDIDRGSVEVKGWDKNEILVLGELDSDTQTLMFKSKGEKTLIKIKISETFYRGNAHSSDGNELKIFVPQNVQVHFKGIDTDFNIAGIDAGVEGKTISGELLINNVRISIKVSSISGDINVTESYGTAYIESIQGDTSIIGNFEDVKLRTVTGDIWADITEIDNVSTNNIAGDTKLSGSLKKDAQVKMTSVKGDLHYEASGILNAKCEVLSQFGGEIVNNLTTDLPNTSHMQQQQLHFVSGNGLGTLVMKTINGTAIINRAL